MQIISRDHRQNVVKLLSRDCAGAVLIIDEISDALRKDPGAAEGGVKEPAPH
jgi:hypothetical protein